MHKRALEILACMTDSLLRSRGLDDSLKSVTDAALQALDADHASVRLCDEDRLSVGARSGVGSDAPAPQFAAGEGLLGWVAQSGQLARVEDSEVDARFSPRQDRGFEVGSVMSVPITNEAGTLGVLSVSAARKGAFGPGDEAMGSVLANAAGQALRTALLEQLAVTDSHTLAYNRNYLLPRLAEEIERAGRGGEPLSILLMDLDHFKSVNDQHGHAVGDDVLCAFADKVRGCVRSIDILVRRGGEEFVLIMPNTNEAGAMDVAERIRAELCRQPLEVDNGIMVRQTASIGVAVWNGSEDPESLDDRADRAMYDAKELGRNRVIAAGPQVRRSGTHRRTTTFPPLAMAGIRRPR